MSSRNYVLFENPGMADFFALFLLGFTDKSGNEQAIGQFGSGFKYAVSAAMRHGLELIVFLGREKITFKTADRNVQGEIARQLIFVREDADGTREEHSTNMTIRMGQKDWSNGVWPVFRELLQNAVDGDPRAYEVVAGVEPRGRDGFTRVFLQATPEVLEIYRNLDRWWKEERHAVFVCEQGRLYPRSGPSDETRWYVKGMFVQSTRETSLFDYDLPNTPITESRTALTGNLYVHVLRLLDASPPEIKGETLRFVIENAQNSRATLEGNLFWSETTRGYLWADAFRRAFPDTLLAAGPMDYLVAARSGRKVVRCPDELAAMLARHGVLTAEQAFREEQKMTCEPFEPAGDLLTSFHEAYARVADRLPEVNRLTITFVRMSDHDRNVAFVTKNRARGEVQFTDTLLRTGRREITAALVDALAQSQAGAGRCDPIYEDKLRALCVQCLE